MTVGLTLYLGSNSLNLFTCSFSCSHISWMVKEKWFTYKCKMTNSLQFTVQHKCKQVGNKCDWLSIALIKTPLTMDVNLQGCWYYWYYWNNTYIIYMLILKNVCKHLLIEVIQFFVSNIIMYLFTRLKFFWKKYERIPLKFILKNIEKATVLVLF